MQASVVRGVSRKVTIVQELLEELRSFDRRNGLRVVTALNKPDGDYRVGVDIMRGQEHVLHYYTANLNDATGALRGFVALLRL